MPAEDITFMPKDQLLSFEEITRFVEIMVREAGIRKVRLTGGEPLVRKDLHQLITLLYAIPGLDNLGLTTNGILLADQAEALYAAGLRRINISLDALDPVKFQMITRRKGYEQVRAGIDAAVRVGFDPIKINAVSIKGITESELVPFGHLARESGIEVRFIEYMPLDADNQWERNKVLLAHEMIEILSREIMPLIPVHDQNPHAPASEFQFADGVGRIGFISSISQPFCESCNRFRITADGKIRNCLFSLEETDIRQLIREQASDQQIVAAVQSSITAKWEGHEINTARFIQPDRPMYSIGG
jgi:cyclic pyranopterin phosphate synthase